MAKIPVTPVKVLRTGVAFTEVDPVVASDEYVIENNGAMFAILEAGVGVDIAVAVEFAQKQDEVGVPDKGGPVPASESRVFGFWPLALYSRNGKITLKVTGTVGSDTVLKVFRA